MHIGSVNGFVAVFVTSGVAGVARVKMRLSRAAVAGFASTGEHEALLSRFFGLLFSHIRSE